MKKLLNQDIINEIKLKDYAIITEKIEEFLLKKIEENKSKGIIFGLSGGIDSAVLAYICKRIIKDKTIAIIMPDTDITPKTETEDAKVNRPDRHQSVIDLIMAEGKIT